MHTHLTRRASLAAALLGFIGLVTLAGCGGDGFVIDDGPSHTGIGGRVTTGATGVQGAINSPLLPGVVVTALSPQGVEAARQTTNNQGYYFIALPPGTYQVQGLAATFKGVALQPPAPQTVTITDHITAPANLIYTPAAQ